MSGLSELKKKKNSSFSCLTNLPYWILLDIYPVCEVCFILLVARLPCTSEDLVNWWKHSCTTPWKLRRGGITALHQDQLLFYFTKYQKPSVRLDWEPSARTKHFHAKSDNSDVQQYSQIKCIKCCECSTKKGFHVPNVTLEPVVCWELCVNKEVEPAFMFVSPSEFFRADKWECEKAV